MYNLFHKQKSPVRATLSSRFLSASSEFGLKKKSVFSYAKDASFYLRIRFYDKCYDNGNLAERTMARIICSRNVDTPSIGHFYNRLRKISYQGCFTCKVVFYIYFFFQDSVFLRVFIRVFHNLRAANTGV